MWTDERVEALRTLWGKGHSASQIARKIGAVSRNGVIGKAYRLGLSGNPAKGEAASRGGRSSALQKKVRAKVKKAADSRRAIVAKLFRAAEFPPEPVPTGPDLVPLVSRLVELEAHHCRWPIGDGSIAFCGRNKVEGLPYCPEHARRAYAGVPQPPLKKVYGGVNRYARQRALAEAGF